MSFDSTIDADLLIVGSGIAGSYAALTASALGARVVMLTKGELLSGSTPWAQGGIAFPDGNDDIALHLADTLTAGRGLSDAAITNEILEESLEHLQLLVEMGMRFDPGRALEGGHSKARVMHAGGDRSGLFLLKFLHQKLEGRVQTLEKLFVYELVTRADGVGGAYFIDSRGERGVVNSKATVLATGGSGQLFSVTTNPIEATGDGVALGFRAGCVIRDVELQQFHPTALLNGTLISEACRGEGAKLLNAKFERFMNNYDPMMELAPRDVVARAVHVEGRRTGSVYLDLTPIRNFEEKFPTVFNSIRAMGIDPTRDLVPVAPAAHYQMGGIKTDSDGRSTVPRLYAAGEVGSTGLHGANRLASNSLLEGLVLGARVATAATKEREVSHPSHCEASKSATGIDPEGRKIIQGIMTSYASVLRSGPDLKSGLEEIRSLKTKNSMVIAEVENANLALLAECVLRGALTRRESRGSHFRSDCPNPSDTPFHVDQTVHTLEIVEGK